MRALYEKATVTARFLLLSLMLMLMILYPWSNRIL